jgi:hypothetical protein
MVEYGGAINNGPAGQVGGGAGGGAPHLGTDVDFFASVGHVINDASAYVSHLPFEVLVAGIVVFFLGLIVLKEVL